MNHFLRTYKFIALCVIILSIPAYAGVLPLFNPQNVVDTNNSFYTKTSLFLANDPTSLKNLLGGLKGTLHQKSGNNLAIGNVRFDIGYSNKYFGYIGYTYREEIFMSASKDTIELLYLVTNKKDLQIGKQYNLDLNIKAFQVQGLCLANKFKVYENNGWKLQLGLALELLHGSDMQDGYVKGNATAVSNKDYNYYAHSNYNYTHNYLYKLNVNSASSYGYSTHISLQLKNDQWSFLLLANDIVAKLYWQQLPYSLVTLTSATKSYNSSGYVRYSPALSGYEGYHNYVQTLLAKYRVQGKYTFYRSSLSLGSDILDSNYMPYINYMYKFTKAFNIGLGYENRFGSMNLNIKYNNYIIALRADDLISPSTLGLTVSARF